MAAAWQTRATMQNFRTASLVLVAVLSLGGLPARAETAPGVTDVLVTAPRLSGYWSVTGPNLIEIKAGPLAGIRIIYSGETDTRDICLLRHLGNGLSATCSAGLSTNAAGGIDQDHITLRWWRGPANLIFNGQWDRKATIDGTFSGGLVGLRVTGSIPASLHKLIPPTDQNPPSLAATESVLGDLRRRLLVQATYEPGAIKRVWRAITWPDAQAAEHQLTFLGTIHVHWQQHQPDLLEDVYEVQSNNHLSLCRISLSPRRRVDDFACQEAAAPTGG